MVKIKRPPLGKLTSDNIARYALIALVAALLAVALVGCGESDQAMSLPSADAGAGTPPPSSGHADAGFAADSGSWGGSADAGAPPSQNTPGAGTLTAGSFDDHNHPVIFGEFLKKMSRTSPGAKLGGAATIRVVDSGGTPMANAKVTVSQGGKLLATMTSGSDGRVVFLPELDGGAYDKAFDVKATFGGKERTLALKLADAPWIVQMPQSVLPVMSKLEVAFVVDATGSMGDELSFLKAEVASIAQQVAAKYNNTTIRFALVVYRDHGDVYVTRTFNFASLASFETNLKQQYAGGGGNYPEAMDAALAAAQQLSWSSDARARMLFLIADAPPHDKNIAASLAAMDEFRRIGVRVFPVAASGVADKAEYVMRVGAYKTFGRYIFLTDDSGYGGGHANPNIPPHTPTQTQKMPCYNVEKLNPLMVRMIASQLEGHSIPPTKAEVLRTVGDNSSGICDPSEKTGTP